MTPPGLMSPTAMRREIEQRERKERAAIATKRFRDADTHRLRIDDLKRELERGHAAAAEYAEAATAPTAPAAPAVARSAVPRHRTQSRDARRAVEAAAAIITAHGVTYAIRAFDLALQSQRAHHHRSSRRRRRRTRAAHRPAKASRTMTREPAAQTADHHVPTCLEKWASLPMSVQLRQTHRRAARIDPRPREEWLITPREHHGRAYAIPGSTRALPSETRRTTPSPRQPGPRRPGTALSPSEVK